MPRPSGLSKTGGRQRGTPNRKTAETIAAAQAHGQLPHEFLCAVAQGREIDGHIPTFEQRLDAAKAAAPFYAPKLSNVDQKITGATVSYVIRAPDMIPDPVEWQRKYAPSETPRKSNGAHQP
jgi:hypothetical protein